MKKILFLLLVLFAVQRVSFSQNNQDKLDDLERIALAAFVPEQADGIPSSARQILLNKMLQISVQNGLGASGENPRFCIVPSLNVISKEISPTAQEISPTAPPMVVVNIEVTFFIVDAASKTIFSQTSVLVKGVGTNKNKAYISGIKNINVKAGQFKNFVETGKQKIIEFYNSQCDIILEHAQALSAQKRYEEALFNLLSVPEVCKDCYGKSMDLSSAIYKEYANNKCAENLSAAKAAWASMDPEKASEFLGQITPDMNCYKEAVRLVDLITKKMIDDGANVWTFKMKKYDNSIEKEKMLIKAKRDVAVAWANRTYWSQSSNSYWNWDWLYKR